MNEKLTIDFPFGGGDVFDNMNNDFFFAYSNSFSRTTNELDELSIEQFEKFIPVGYKSILICKRVKLLEYGNVISSFDDEPKGDYILFSDSFHKLFVPNWKREIETTTIYKPNFLDLSISSASWEDLNECINYGHVFSKANNCRIVVASILDVLYWH